MNESTLNRVIEILQTDPDFYVPVKKVWLTIRQEGLSPDISLEEFQAQLEADERFEFIGGVDHSQGFQDPELAAQMKQDAEAMGFFSGPRVKLKARAMKAQDVIAGLSRSLNQLNEVLKEAWNNRPEEDPQAEEMLRDALTMAEQLEQEIQEIIEDQGQTSGEGE